MDSKEDEENDEDSKLGNDLRREFKSCQTGVHDLLKEYRTRLEELQKENMSLSSENDKFKLTESDKCKKLSDENKELNALNLNLKEELIAYQFKLAHVKKHLLDEEKAFKQELEAYQARLNDSKQELENLRRKCTDYETVKLERDRALEYVHEYVAKLENFEQKLVKQRQDSTKMLEQKIDDLSSQLESLNREKNFRIGQLSIKVSHLEAKLNTEFNENRNLKRINEKNEALISELKSKLDASAKEVVRLTDLVKLSEENEKKLTDKIRLFESDFLKLNREMTLLMKENSNLNEKCEMKIEKEMSKTIEDLKKENENLSAKITLYASEIEQLLASSKALKEKEFFAHASLLKELENAKQSLAMVIPLEKEVKILKKQLRIKRVQLRTSESLFNKQNDEFNQVFAKLEDALAEKSQLEVKLNETRLNLELRNKELKEVSSEKLLLESKLERMNLSKQKCVNFLKGFLYEFEMENEIKK